MEGGDILFSALYFFHVNNTHTYIDVHKNTTKTNLDIMYSSTHISHAPCWIDEGIGRMPESVAHLKKVRSSKMLCAFRDKQKEPIEREWEDEK